MLRLARRSRRSSTVITARLFASLHVDDLGEEVSSQEFEKLENDMKMKIVQMENDILKDTKDILVKMRYVLPPLLYSPALVAGHDSRKWPGDLVWKEWCI